MNNPFKNLTEKQIVFIIIGISTLIRAAAAAMIELGNDESYYWCYAMFPDLSHFDHPPMVGFLIQTLTGNLVLGDEFFIRLGSIIIGAANTFLIYVIGRAFKDERTGMYAALLYSASIYCSVIVGTFIMPDTPQSCFFLLAIYFLHNALISKSSCRKKTPAAQPCQGDGTDKSLPYLSFKEEDLPEEPFCDESEVRHLGNHAFLLAGLCIGLATLSKYTSLYLWAGAGIYILLFNRKVLLNPFLYISAAISALIMLPILVWNINNDFISFTFHGDRVSHFTGLNPIWLGREIFGNVFYNNPVNFILIIFALIAYKKNKYLDMRRMGFLLSMSLPLIATFLAVSLFKPTLPHWSAPAYYALIIITAAWMSESDNKGNSTHINRYALYSNLLAVLVIAIGILQINLGIFDPFVRFGEKENVTGKNDVTLDMYGWDQLHDRFTELRYNDIITGKMPETAYIVADKWYEAAHQDYYVAWPNKMDLKTIGPIGQTHKYAWITEDRGGIKPGDNAYFIESSRYSTKGFKFGLKYFETVEQAGRIDITRNGKPVMYYTVYRFKNLVTMPEKELVSVPDRHRGATGGTGGPDNLKNPDGYGIGCDTACGPRTDSVLPPRAISPSVRGTDSLTCADSSTKRGMDSIAAIPAGSMPFRTDSAGARPSGSMPSGGMDSVSAKPSGMQAADGSNIPHAKDTTGANSSHGIATDSILQGNQKSADSSSILPQRKGTDTVVTQDSIRQGKDSSSAEKNEEPEVTYIFS